MKELILNADDFGLTRGVNEGIVRAHRDGILTSATVMATAPAFDHAVELARANPRLGVGCHLVLVGGKAAAPWSEIPSLVDSSGQLPESLAAFVARLSLGRVPVSEMEREFRAQIEKIREAGIEPTHLDTHKHTHAHPQVMKALGRAASAFGIRRVRNPIENLSDSWGAGSWAGRVFSKQLLAAGLVRVMARRFHTVAREYGLRSPERFLGVAVTGLLGPSLLRRLIGTVGDGCTEIMLHPGISDQALARTGSRLQAQRETELAALLDSGVKGSLLEQNIRLISYRELN